LDEITKQALGTADINSMANGTNGGHF
jgi:hypothetical protein